MDANKKNSPRFHPNSRIDHAVFGQGTILAVNDVHTTIAFDANGTRKFMTSIVKLTPSDSVAPERPVRRKKQAASK